MFSGVTLYDRGDDMDSWTDLWCLEEYWPPSCSWLGELYLETVAPGPAVVTMEIESGGIRQAHWYINSDDVAITVRDPQVNGVCSGLKRESLVIKLNGNILLPSSEVVVTDVYTLVDGVNTLTELQIGIARWVLGEGTSLLRIEIDDNVGNRTISEQELSMP
ncbi:MAG: hypothetical protein A2Y77_07935 [Planctomycetes bacterium RBG_13_62_9]|nr:MAG: hypothetical protein A2Y77_07935 [Planctomycetes bacterium RBG_13_62_9]